MQYSFGARGVRVAETPTFSVLVAATGPADQLAACLRQIEPVCARVGAQLVVAHAHPDSDLRDLRAAYPAVRFVGGRAGMDAAELRALGLAGVEGDIVVISSADRITPEEILDRFTARATNDRA